MVSGPVCVHGMYLGMCPHGRCPYGRGDYPKDQRAWADWLLKGQDMCEPQTTEQIFQQWQKEHFPRNLGITSRRLLLDTARKVLAEAEEALASRPAKSPDPERARALMELADKYMTLAYRVHA